MKTTELTIKEISRFWSKVRVGAHDDCWMWKASDVRGDYGQFSRSRNKNAFNEGSHRIAYRLTFGPIPKGLCVLHKCDNPPCCNPAHLFLGTALENARDMKRKGRSLNQKGEANHSDKLSEPQIEEIRSRYNHGSVTQKAIGEEFCVTQSMISRIVNDKNWTPAK